MIGSFLAPKWPILVPFCGMDHQKSNFSLIFDTLPVGGCWVGLLLRPVEVTFLKTEWCNSNFQTCCSHYTPLRTARISGLKSFKSWNDHFWLKIYSEKCCCPVQKNLHRRAELAWLVSRYLWRGTWNFKIFFSRPLFTIIFKPKMVISRLKILVHLFWLF